jgi:hypothetical protein
MKNVRNEIAVWIQLGSFVVMWAIVLYVSGVELRINWEALKKIPEVIALYSILHLFFTSWAWRLRMFQGWLVPFPDLQGTWEGTLKSTWQDPATGKVIPPMPVTLVIRQSFSSIGCVMHSRESTSYSNAGQISRDDDSGILRLSYSYTNRPKATIRDRSAIHDGASILRIIMRLQPSLEGEYWTSRKTTGDISLKFKSRHLAGGFSDQAHEAPMKGWAE